MITDDIKSYTISISMKGLSLGLRAILKLTAYASRKIHDYRFSGEMSLKDFNKAHDVTTTTVLTYKDEIEINIYRNLLKKYGVDFSIQNNGRQEFINENDEKIVGENNFTLYFRAKDAAVMEEAFKSLTYDKVKDIMINNKSENMPSNDFIESKEINQETPITNEFNDNFVNDEKLIAEINKEGLKFNENNANLIEDNANFTGDKNLIITINNDKLLKEFNNEEIFIKVPYQKEMYLILDREDFKIETIDSGITTKIAMPPNKHLDVFNSQKQVTGSITTNEIHEHFDDAKLRFGKTNIRKYAQTTKNRIDVSKNLQTLQKNINMNRTR